MRGLKLILTGGLLLTAYTTALRAENPPESVPALPSAVEAAPAPPPVAPAAEFKPPFPQRNELFLPPNTKGLTKAQREEVRTEVILKGFVNVDGLRAVLVINGKPLTLAAGESNSGVEVVAINPPEITLQRGRVRWNEVLFNGTSAKSK